MMRVKSDQLRTDLEEILRFLPGFARNPVEGMKLVSNWGWPALLSLQIGTAMVSGVSVGLLSLSFWNFILGLLVFPLTSLLQAAVITFFLSSFFALIRTTFLERRRLFGLFVFANLPYFILHILSGHVPPIDLIGFAATCTLLIVGLSEHFRLERGLLIRLMGGIYLTFFLIWAASHYKSVQHSERFNDISSPKSIDALEHELQAE